MSIEGRDLRSFLTITAAAVAATCVAAQLSGAAPVVTIDPADGLHQQVQLAELPMPPTAPSTEAGSCTAAVAPHGTGCVSPVWGALGSIGTYRPDSRFVLVGAEFAGAPAAGDTSVYTGPQVLLVHADGKTFGNGDAWKCLTCGLPAPEQTGDTSTFKYPVNGFHDGKRALAGTSVIDCGAYEFADDKCTAAQVHSYPLFWDVGTGTSGELREPRLDPDDTHIGFSHVVQSATAYDEFGFAGRLRFDPAGARYEITDTRMLFDPAPQDQPYVIDGSTLKFNRAGMIGEFRGWTADGRAALGVQSYESGSIDLWATDNSTGASRALTRHAEYTDPNAASPDGKHLLSEQVIGSGRVDFIAGMQGIAPITDQLPTTGHVSGIRNAGMRRFFLPYLVDTESGRSRQIDVGADPNWNAAADPAWLADSTAAVWAENLACGANPSPHRCDASSEPGGRNSRIMIARFGFQPCDPPRVAPVPDVAWGIAYHPGDAFPTRPHLPAGTYTLPGAKGGSAQVVITEDAARVRIMEIAVSYTKFSDAAGNVIDGTESVTRGSDSAISAITWHENLTQSGRHTGTKVTSPEGFTLSTAVLQSNFQATGTLTTTIDGQVYTQPTNGS